ncbi:DMT family transporter [Bacillus sp. T33-2]|uniref:DMT family transporter n=1 Tax=Bacillus sp. T33-2 TaxID=2054168 RepID=UPI000C77B512|nr:DMT family transporter [Bacillus sp. T33-2]PLR97454.1 EamA family transporter [Bacillus sp. T33-2]
MGKLYTALIMLSLIWGTSFLFIKVLLDSLGPSAVVFGRCLFGMIFLGAVMLYRKEKLVPERKYTGKIFAVGFMNNALPWLLISLGETKISSSLASIINATTPIWTLIIGFLFFSSILKKNHWIGIGLGFIGIIILSDIRPGEFLTGNTAGVLLMLGAALCYGAGTQLTKKHLTDLPVTHISFYTLTAAAAVSFMIMVLLEPQSLLKLVRLETIIPLLGLGSLGSGAAYLLFYYLVKEGSPEFASLVTYLVPVSAIVWGAMLLEESIHMSMLAGLAVIFLGVYISTAMERGKKKTKMAA